MTRMPPLVANAISRAFKGHQAVLDASLTLEPGELTALIGQSGSGKTTFLRLLAGMERPDAGDIRTGDTVLASATKHVPVEARKIGLVFQDFALFPHLDVFENVTFGLRDVPKADRAGIADRWIETLGLSHRRSAYPHQLSGGEQQRTAIARALAPKPVAILLDEPFSGLDPAMRDRARDVALGAVRHAGIPALLVTHDATEALVHADKVAIIDKGHILQTGAPEQVYQAPKNLAAAQALGSVHGLERSALPAAWQSILPGVSQQIHYRAEAIQFGDQVDAIVTKMKLAGPVYELTLNVGSDLSVFATCQPQTPVTVGESVKLSINPDLVFSFPDS